MAHYSEIRKHLDETPAGARGNMAKAQEILAKAPDGFISQTDAFDILAAYKLPIARTTRITAAEMPSKIKFPAVLKVDSADVVHKSDAGGVKMDITRRAALQKAVEEMSGSFPGAKFVVQEQCPKGTEIIVGLKREKGVGPVIMFGMGGVQVEALKDVSFRMAPLTEGDAARMVQAIRSFPLLKGSRNIPASDLAAIEKLLISVSQLAVDLPEIAEMDLNPAIVYPEGQGIKVVDVRIKKQGHELHEF
jgi:acetyltransferase